MYKITQLHLYVAPWCLYSIAALVLKVALSFPCPHLTSSAICLCEPADWAEQYLV